MHIYMSKVYIHAYITGYSYVNHYSVDVYYVKVCMVVVHQLVHTVHYTVACMMMTHVMMIDLPLHWWVGLNQYFVPVSLVIQSHH